jgi:hypothetical protein
MNYLNIYNNIIERAKTRVLGEEIYVEKHHIIPKCMEGGDEIENKVKLTAREHFLCHWLLCRIYPENKSLSAAFWVMCHNSYKKELTYKFTARTYEEARILHSINHKEWHKNLSKEKRKEISNKLSQIYQNKSEEEKQIANEKRRKKLKNRKYSEKTLLAMSKSHLGVKYSKETCQKRNKANIGKHSFCVLQFDLNWNFIKEWPSLIEASIMLHCDVSGYLNTYQKTAANSFWEYKDEPKTEEQKQQEKANLEPYYNKEIYQFDLKGNFIREWPSLKSIIDKIKINNINACLKNFQQTAGGFKWKYKENIINN